MSTIPSLFLVPCASPRLGFGFYSYSSFTDNYFPTHNKLEVVDCICHPVGFGWLYAGWRRPLETEAGRRQRSRGKQSRQCGSSDEKTRNPKQKQEVKKRVRQPEPLNVWANKFGCPVWPLLPWNVLLRETWSSVETPALKYMPYFSWQERHTIFKKVIHPKWSAFSKNTWRTN